MRDLDLFITRAQLDAAAIAARNEFYGADRGPEATSEWRWVVLAALNAISPDQLGNLANTWLAVEAHILASHTCPDVESDPRIRAWLAITVHPFFTACYSTDGTLAEAILAKLAAAHTHVCEPVWRPASFEEIQAGWEVRSRRRNGSEAGWGVAHHRDGDGDWFTETGSMLTYDFLSWAYETTAPAPEPEPWPDEVVESLVKTLSVGQDAIAVLDALAARYPGVRAAITGGEQS